MIHKYRPNHNKFFALKGSVLLPKKSLKTANPDLVTLQALGQKAMDDSGAYSVGDSGRVKASNNIVNFGSKKDEGLGIGHQVNTAQGVADGADTTNKAIGARDNATNSVKPTNNYFQVQDKKEENHLTKPVKAVADDPLGELSDDSATNFINNLHPETEGNQESAISTRADNVKAIGDVSRSDENLARIRSSGSAQQRLENEAKKLDLNWLRDNITVTQLTKKEVNPVLKAGIQYTLKINLTSQVEEQLLGKNTRTIRIFLCG
jgi:hypothetical protein